MHSHRVARWLPDLVITAALAAAVFVAHQVSYLVHHPFWFDETWVATLTRAPLSRAFAPPASTPIGWLLLLRAVPGGGEAMRLVPLLFAAAEVAAAYVLARGLPWGSERYARLAGASVGLLVLLAPTSLLRNELKQYTADAFFSLAILLLASRAEGSPGPRTMVELALLSVVAPFFSTAAAFVVAAVFAGLLGTALRTRSMERIRLTAVAALGVGAAVTAYLGLVVSPHVNTVVRAFWNDFYLPYSLGAVSESWDRFRNLSPAIGVSAVVAIALFVSGCVVLARLGRPGLACAVALLWPEMLILGMARRYPFLDLRTSYFLYVVSLVTIATGFLGIVRALASRWRLLVTVIALFMVGAYVNNSRVYLREHSIPREDTRSAARYVARHRHAGDVVVVTSPSGFGFSYYWPRGHVQFLSDPSVSTGFVTRVRGLRDVVYVNGVESSATTRAMRNALRAARRHTPAGRIFVVRSHLYRSEAAAWHRTFRALHLHPALEQVGSEPIWIVPAR